MSALVDDEKPETLERFVRAMAPIDEMRSTQDGSDDEDEELLPEPPSTGVPATPTTGTPVVASPTPSNGPVAPAPQRVIEPGMPGADPFLRNP